VLLTDAIVVSELDQTIPLPLLRAFVLPSLYVAVALICCVLPWFRVKVEGPTVSVVAVGFWKNPVQATAAPIMYRVASVPTN
jgi:hypothetical protein